MMFNTLVSHRAPRRTRLGACLLISLAAALGCASANARDLSRNDPDRAAILDAVRGDPDARLVVKDLVRWGDLAYVCALKQDRDGDYYRTDESIEVYQSALARRDGTWDAVGLGGGFAGDGAHVDCNVDDAPVTQENLGRLLAQSVQSSVLDALDYGQMSGDYDGWLRWLAQHHLLGDFSIEHEKRAYTQDQAQFSSKPCGKSQPCRKKIADAYTALTKASADASVSSLVWTNCGYGLRVTNLAIVAACVDKFRAAPDCRTGQHYGADHASIGRCIGAIKRQCKADLGEQGPCN